MSTWQDLTEDVDEVVEVEIDTLVIEYTHAYPNVPEAVIEWWATRDVYDRLGLLVPVKPREVVDFEQSAEYDDLLQHWQSEEWHSEGLLGDEEFSQQSGYLSDHWL